MEGSSSPPYDPSHPYNPSSPIGEADKNKDEALPKQSEEREESETQATSLIGSNWPSLPLSSESESPIQPGQGQSHQAP